MLYILAIPEYIYTFLRGNVDISFIDLFVIRIPLIIADFIILLILIKLLRNTKQILIWYWFNPIVIYISYVHGQLDIIPTAFLFLSLYFLFNNKLFYFLLFLAVSCSIKFHNIIVVPFVIIYLLKSKKISYSLLLKGFLAFSILLFLFNFPFIFQNEFIQMVYNNSEQGKVFA
jgi:Gpi18-like mannosyltransferase